MELGRAPTAGELGDVETVREGWRALHEAHALVLDPATDEIRMANPFSAVPTSYRVSADDRWWYANCAWDALGIPSMIQADAAIEARCPDCSEAIRIQVKGNVVSGNAEVVRFEVPPAHFWDNIIHT